MLVGVVLTARKRLAGDFRLGLAVFGVALVALAASGQLRVAIVLFGVMGIGSTLVDVTGTTLLQRSAPSNVVGRVFGVLQSLMLVHDRDRRAHHAVASSPLIGPRGTFVAFGALLPILAILTWRRGRARIDASSSTSRPSRSSCCSAIPIFAPLPPAAIERLAAIAAEVRLLRRCARPSRRAIAGDRFFVIAEGTAAVEIGGLEKTRLGAGDFFGEIALLRDVPRTATVTAIDELRLYALERDDFIAAVTGYAPSQEAADSVVAMRLPAGAAL